MAHSAFHEVLMEIRMGGVIRLLVPVDGSDHSLRALAHVLERVATDPHQFELFLLNVQPLLPHSLFVKPSMIEKYHRAKSKEELLRALRMLRRKRLKAEVIIRAGDPGQIIPEVARQKHCREIVMGCRGLGNLKGLILGSVTTKVIHASRVPVTVVP